MTTRLLPTVALAACLLLAGCSVSVGVGDETPTGAAPAVDGGTPAPGTMAAGDLPAGPRLSARVVEVVDGDTIDVRLSNGTTDTVRLLGIDTPEVHAETDTAEYEGVPASAAGRDCLRRAGERASTTVREALAGESVTLALDPEADTRGGYGRLLAYVVHDGVVVNYGLVRGGHARLYDAPFARLSAFAAAERTARAGDRGLWRCRNPPA